MGWTRIAALAPLLMLALAFKSPQASAACAALPTDKGIATATVNIPSTGSYRVWSRISAPTTASNSYFLQIDDTNCGIVVGDASIPVNTYTWVDYQGGNSASKITVNLTAGNHTVKMAGREASVRLDKILFLSDQACVPIAFGDNCTANSNVAPVTGTGSTGSTDNTSKPGTNTVGSSSQTASTSSSAPLTPAQAVSKVADDVLQSPVQIPLPGSKQHIPFWWILAPVLLGIAGASGWLLYKFKVNPGANPLVQLSVPTPHALQGPTITGSTFHPTDPPNEQ